MGSATDLTSLTVEESPPSVDTCVTAATKMWEECEGVIGEDVWEI